ncbi:MAG TPA: helix-turn-helix domain-containing protein [Candidatus Binatia bacterium]|jgi:IS1 family transposase|nr:helix-turn-helix domain-containing protein [Candidatus Binatia bacterium]
MNKLSADRRAQILGMMVEGMSIRAITRLTGVSKNTVAKLLVTAGQACLEYQDATLRNLPCTRVQCDEIWSFVYAKDKNLPEEKRGQIGAGSVWTWTAICADTKIIPSFYVGTRDAGAAYEFINDLAKRLTYRVQLTTDGHKAYLDAVDSVIGYHQIDYAQLIKVYGAERPGEARYSPATCIGTEFKIVAGNPDPKHISTSYVERQNLSMRMGMRRFTRLTNAFSKKLENHVHAIAIYFMHYNFVRVHQTLRCSPAMEAKVTTKLWSLADMVAMIEAWEAKQPKGETAQVD